MHLVYTWFFPGALSAVIVWNLVVELRSSDQPASVRIIASCFAAAAIGNILVYLVSTKWRHSRLAKWWRRR
jgi:hypothetical protein